MFYYKAIDSRTLELLRAIQDNSIFNSMRLVGGTALALQIGHRRSVDLDFFGKLEADHLEVIELLKSAGTVKVLRTTKNINVFAVDGVKVDIVNYPYPWLCDVVTEDNIVVAEVADIAAMKLAAVTGRGAKRDFVDIFFLLKRYNLAEILEFYCEKYAEGSSFLVLKSLTYFEDAEEEAMPMVFEEISWQDVKETIRRAAAELS